MNTEEEEVKQPEYMEVDEDHTSNPTKSFSSLFSIQSASLTPTPFQAKTSSSTFRPTLHRSSRSDITNLHSDDKDLFNVSKSFGQFTFGQNESTDSKDSLYINKPGTLSEDSIQKENNQDIKLKIEKAKRKLRPLMRKEKKTKSIYTCSCWKIIFFLLLPVMVALISIILNQQQIGSKFCEPSLNMTNVTAMLPKLVYGQTQGVLNLIELFTNVLKFKVIALVGGTGVGKSHVANIIKNSLPPSYYTFEYFPPLYKKVRQAYSVLSTCQCNFIILENLGTKDISDAALFSQALQNRASDLCVVILALFNTQVTHSNLRRSMDLKGSVQRIENGFMKEGIEVKVVGFEPLLEESLMKCIMEAVKAQQLKLLEKDIEHIRKSLLEANSGCKGASSKVRLVRNVSD